MRGRSLSDQSLLPTDLFLEHLEARDSHMGLAGLNTEQFSAHYYMPDVYPQHKIQQVLNLPVV